MRRWRWTTVVVVVVLVLAGSVFLMASKGARACTKVGCGTQASFDLRSLDPTVRADAASVTVCLDGVCTTNPVTSTYDGIDARLPTQTTIRTGTVTIEGGDGSELATFALDDPVDVDRWYPNGEDCEPTCPVLPLVASNGVLRKQDG